jgi:hypothetical protein
MCLYVDKIKTAIGLKDTSTKEFYKVFYKDSKCLKSPYFKYTVTGPGVYTSPDTLLPFTDMVGRGVFHARIGLSSTKQDLF